jgi:BlaI family transcriptional regulator, penicillinase repressor
MVDADKRVVSPTELKVLKVLWENSPLSANQIIDALENVESWHSRTVKSLINRLLKKKAIAYKQGGNRYLYYPLLNKNEYLKKTSQGFIQGLFAGKISPLVAHFVKHEQISKEDIQELKNILEELESNNLSIPKS